MLLQAQQTSSVGGSLGKASIFNGVVHAEVRAHMLDYAPAPGWTVHVNKDGRLYYCNHVTKTASWLPPAETWRAGEDSLPYGWERALDDSGRSYYINHVNKTTTYETPITRALLPTEEPEPRTVVLERSAALGFGFVAGSEKPVIVRFVTESGPSVDKLLPGDQIIQVNGEDVKTAPREHVISLIRACSATVTLVICQPAEQSAGARKSTLLSASKRARLRSKPSRVRFAESVCVNGAPLFPPSAFSLGDLQVAPMANVLKVFLENGQTKSFKYDAWTTVADVTASLQSKLCVGATQHFSLVVEHIKSLKRNKLTLLDPNDTIARIASRPGAHKLRCLYRIAYVPSSAASLAQQDLVALDYLFIQCCNDVIQERFAPELQYDVALRLAALHVYQHALANNMQASKLTVKTVEREFGLERFVPASLLEKMKRKEVRKLVAHFLKLHGTMAGPGKQLTALQAKLHYLDIVSQLPSYGAKCFSAGPKADAMERVILVSPKFGISQITGSRNSLPQPIANIEDIQHIDVVTADDELMHNVYIHLKKSHQQQENHQVISITLEERDANELVLVLKGYHRLATDSHLQVNKEDTQAMEDLAPPYLSQHKVVPDRWSYLNQAQVKSVVFTVSPTYQNVNRKTNGLYNTMGRQSSKLGIGMGFNLDSNMNSCAVKNNEVFKDFKEIKESDFTDVRELKEQLKTSAKWQETSVDVESDFEVDVEDGADADGDIGGEEDGFSLRHSDSLLLLATSKEEKKKESSCFTNAAIEILRSELTGSTYSESDNDSLYTPHNSPRHFPTEQHASEDVGRRKGSFGLHSPDQGKELRRYLEELKQHTKRSHGSSCPEEKGVNGVCVDPDIIDLTLLPPPGTPDALDTGRLPAINIAPTSFADLQEVTMEDLSELELEEFLASVTIQPPTQKVTPAVELTPEEIMSFIIPPPPDINSQQSIQIDRKLPQIPPKPRKSSPLNTRRASVDLKPPDRPPKSSNSNSCQISSWAVRQRSQSMVNPGSCKEIVGIAPIVPPKLPPKPPLPPLPPLEVLRSRKNMTFVGKNGLGGLSAAGSGGCKDSKSIKTAGIGSPHLQRNRNMYNDLEVNLEDVDMDVESNKMATGSTAVSTPTSPFLGRGAQLTTIPLDSPNALNGASPNIVMYVNNVNANKVNHNHLNHHQHYLHSNSSCAQYSLNTTSTHCMSSREQLLAKTDTAMASLLLRLEQLTVAQVASGHEPQKQNEEQFQMAKGELTTQSLQLVHSSKMLVIAMSDTSKPDLPEHLATCLGILRRLTELCADLTKLFANSINSTHATPTKKSPNAASLSAVQTRNLVRKVHDVTAAFRHLISSDIDRSSPATIEEHLAGEAEALAGVLTTLLRSLRIFSP